MTHAGDAAARPDPLGLGSVKMRGSPTASPIPCPHWDISDSGHSEGGLDKSRLPDPFHGVGGPTASVPAGEGPTLPESSTAGPYRLCRSE
jgi:hypothetical protein